MKQYKAIFANASDVYTHEDYANTLTGAKRKLHELVVAFGTNYDIYGSKAEIAEWNEEAQAYITVLAAGGNKSKITYNEIY